MVFIKGDRIKRVIGAIFCQVARIRQSGQFKAFIIGGSQKWHGAIPIFRRRDKVRPKKTIFGKNEESKIDKDEDRRSRPEPMA